VALGGSVAWIPPPTGPTPGPWVGGAIIPQPLIAGASVAEALMAAPTLTQSIISNLPPTLKQQGGVPTPGMFSFVQGIATGISQNFNIWKSTTLITGGVGSGVGAPGGVIVSGVLAGAVLS
jgi:hypothetical protein